MAATSPTRISGARLIGPGETLQIARQAAAPLAAETMPVTVAAGLVLAETVVADRDYPPFPRAMMDGYAVRVEEAGKQVPVAEEIAAGEPAGESVEAGRCHEIMTGCVEPGGREGVCSVRPLAGVGSADIFRAHSANCYIEIPPGREPIPAGTPIAFSRLNVD